MARPSARSPVSDSQCTSTLTISRSACISCACFANTRVCLPERVGDDGDESAEKVAAEWIIAAAVREGLVAAAGRQAIALTGRSAACRASANEETVALRCMAGVRFYETMFCLGE